VGDLDRLYIVARKMVDLGLIRITDIEDFVTVLDSELKRHARRLARVMAETTIDAVTGEMIVTGEKKLDRPLEPC